jgi:hypothetical protein
MMNRHGATVVGGSVKELVSRSVFMCDNARHLLNALLLGSATPLHPGETRLAGSISLMPSVIARTWEYWSIREGSSGKASKPGKKRKR